ncbi:MAG: hypothetical protein IJT94_13445 [Oscillibacter sp.]|nr:hypothetical protein [Oscillibacter sp.]
MSEEERLIHILRRPDWVRLRLADLLDQRETCRRRCTRTTARYGGTASSGGRFSRGDLAMAELADLDRLLARCRARLAEASERAEALLRQVENLPGRTAVRDADLLRLRYLRGLSGEPLRAAMEQAGYPARAQTIYNWQRSARRSGVLALAAMDHAATSDPPRETNPPLSPLFEGGGPRSGGGVKLSERHHAAPLSEEQGCG